MAPFHPLVLLGRAIGGSRWEIVASVLLALTLGALSYALLRRKPRMLSLTAAIACAALFSLLPLRVTLPIGGAIVAAASIVAVMRYPSRRQWTLAVVATALAVLGTTPPFAWWLAVAGVPALAAVALSRDPWRGSVAAMAAAVAAIGLTAFWWMPALGAGAHDAPVQKVLPLSFAGGLEPDHVPEKIQRLAQSQAPPVTPRAFEIVRREPGRITIEVDRGHGWGLAALGEPWWPGWRVYWNGERLPPVRVGGATVGSFVPPGEGTLELRYRPDSFDAGLHWMGTAFLFVAATLAWPWFLRIRRRPAPARPRIRAPVERFRAAMPALAAITLVGYAYFLVDHRVTTAGGADSSGYLNAARLWLRGTPVVPIEPPRPLESIPSLAAKLIPLGFAPGPEPGTMAPTYPPGLPFHFAAARLLGGESAIWFVAPIVSTAGVILMALLARQFGLTWPFAVTGAAVLALFPTFVMFATLPMSDAVATAWTLATMLLALRSRASPARAAGWAAACGTVFGFSVLLRPTQILLLPAVILTLGLRLRALVSFAAGGVPFAFAQMAIASRFWGSPFRTGYGSIEPLLALANVPERLRNYATWLAQLASPLVFPAGFAALAAREVPRHTRLALALWFVPFFAFYCFYRPADAWWYTRFLLPAFPAVILLALFGLRSLLAKVPAGARAPLAFLLVAAVLATEIRQIAVYDAHEMARADVEYPRSIAAAAAVVPRGVVVAGMQLSGAYYYYRGETMVRYDFLSEDETW
ncbi:MAG: hypothetical protein ACRELV_08335, partial [Longimicrobiales bacterium]